MSDAIIELQKKIGVKADGNFGPMSLKAARDYFKLTNEQAAHFFGQCAHESSNFTVFSENLNYSADGLLKTFKKYFTKEQAAKYAHNPVAIASHVYAHRMGNSGEETQDGWKYRGRGAIQLTGRDNYKAFNETLKNDNIMTLPDRVATVYAFESAKFFFDDNHIWVNCDKVDTQHITAVTKQVNGGTNGLAARTKLTNQFYDWLTK